MSNTNVMETAMIETTAKLTAQEVVAELKKQGLLKDIKQTPFQKTETLLYNYNHFLAVVKDNAEEIEDVRKNGISGRSKSITSFSNNPSYEFKNDFEKAEEEIESLEKRIQITKKCIHIIDSAMDKLKDDRYFDIIRLKYFENKSREAIAEYFEVDASTISRNKNRIINILKIRLFSDEVIYQIFR